MPSTLDRPESIDLDHLLRARLWVGRLGESDVLSWWRTDGVLGEDGAFVGPRVLPKTHGTGRARIVFAVARHACQERYPSSEAKHLFALDPATEDRLDAYLLERLEAFEWWTETLAGLEAVGSDAEAGPLLTGLGLVSEEDLTYVDALPLGPDGRSLPLASGETADQSLRRLTAGFARSNRGQLAVPYLLDGEGS